FSYGTLREEKVQREIFGHTLAGAPDAIVGYRLEALTIADARAISISGKSGHTVLEPTGRDADQVEGMVFALTDAELLQADAYEDEAYRRIEVRLRSGAGAWVYVRA
ncbi:MAG TPA: gamma-glutamylcyclotransferase family protein, partial [Caulobacteraceae bacterium]|nr:gamma-glutamylcyclotransferase family protein [Caulobacteraceae bacterium]